MSHESSWTRMTPLEHRSKFQFGDTRSGTMNNAPTNNTIHVEKPLSKYDRGLQLISDRKRDQKNFDRVHARLIRCWIRQHSDLTFVEFIKTEKWRGVI